MDHRHATYALVILLTALTMLGIACEGDALVNEAGEPATGEIFGRVIVGESPRSGVIVTIREEPRLTVVATRITDSSAYDVANPDPTGRLLDICLQAGATEYLSGPAAKSYLDESLFARAGITVRYMDYAGYPEYPQLHGPFEHAVTVLDSFRHGQPALLDVCADDRLEVVRGDAREKDTLVPLVRKADVLIPLAALVGAPACDQDRVAARTTNLDAVRLLLSLRSGAQRPRISPDSVNLGCRATSTPAMYRRLS